MLTAQQMEKSLEQYDLSLNRRELAEATRKKYVRDVRRPLCLHAAHHRAACLNSPDFAFVRVASSFLGVEPGDIVIAG